MNSLDQHHSVLLQKVLDEEYIPNLPPLLNSKSPEEQQKKNRSRAFSAFALYNLCHIPKCDAALSVIDDFDDYGVDAIYYHAVTETLFLVQSKLKAAEKFSQEEALSYCQGVRKLIKQDLIGFNKNVQNRKVEIEDALDNCSHIQLVVAHTGKGISVHAQLAIDEILSDEDHGEERLAPQVINYDAAQVVHDLLTAKAYERVDVDLWLQKCALVAEPRVTYFGLVHLTDLVLLHKKHDKALYERNIRVFLGHKTEVNASIEQTLATKPQEFLYLNNGVTALCQEIQPKGAKQAKGGRKRLKIKGFSVINGAQTIATSARFLEENPNSGLSSAKVSITLIKADSDGDFGKAVTRARNHQNPVLLSNFAALDDKQEDLRRAIAFLDIHYSYKAEGPDKINETNRIRIDEAAQALAMLQTDPRYVVWLKKEPARILDTASDQYKALFSPATTAFQLVNAVRINRYVQNRMESENRGASGQERLAYKHGNYAAAWVLAKRVREAINTPALINEEKLHATMSAPFDELRQILWNKTKAATLRNSGPPPEYFKGSLALFRNQTDLIPLLLEIASENYGLETDLVLEHKKRQQTFGEPYPQDLFAYLVSKAPQIGELS
ncbi:MAG: putative abortive infection phage resistance protein [Nitrospirales bacterium]|nr:MAG: putative abortive infection phage resistance protein [Nitrospirales bacterium]